MPIETYFGMLFAGLRRTMATRFPPVKRRGGARKGAGRRFGEANRRIRVYLSLSPAVHDRWAQLKTLRKFSSDSDLATYLVDMAMALDESGQSR